MVILVYSHINKKQRQDGGKYYKTHVRYYIPILAVFDLATLIFGAMLPLTLTNVWVCKGRYFLMFSAVRTSGLILLLISIFMYIALFPKRVFSIRQLRMSVVAVTILGVVATVPDLFSTKYKTDVRYVNETTWKTRGKQIDESGVYFNETYVRSVNQTVSQTYCIIARSSTQKAAISVSLVIVLLILLAVCCLYARILQILITKLKRASKKERPRNADGHLDSSHEMELESKRKRHETNRAYDEIDMGSNIELDVYNQRSENAVIKTASADWNIQRQEAKMLTVMFFIIVIFYGVSYIPFHIIGLVDIVNTNEEERKAQNFIRSILVLFGFINHIINPFIYGCFDAIFRKTCKDIFYNLRCK